MGTKRLEPKQQFDGGALFPALVSQQVLSTDSSGNLIGGVGGAVFIQTTDPGLAGVAAPYFWIQVDGSGNLISMWVNA